MTVNQNTSAQSSSSTGSQSAPAAGAAPAAAAAAPAANSGAADPAVAAAAAAAAPAVSAIAPRPGYILESEYDAVTGKVDDAKANPRLAGLVANDAAEQSRKLTLPKTAEAYEMKLPADFKMPEGVTFEFNKGDGAIAQAQAFALKNGLTQDQFSELAGIYAGNRAGELATFNTAKTAELAKLGGAGTARITAVQTWLTAMGGPEAAALVRVLEYAPVAGTIVAMENLMKKFSSQGGADFSQAHREGAADPAVIPGYDTMSFTQRRAAQMSQKAAK